MTWIRAARWVLSQTLPPDDAEAVLGDLREDTRESGRPSRVLFDAA